MQGDEGVRALLAAGSVGDAATEVIRAHGPAVLRYLRSALHDEGAAAEAFSLFAEWAWAGIGRFRGESSVRTWALGVAWNAAQRVRRGAAGRRWTRLATTAAERLAAEVRTASGRRDDQRAAALEALRGTLRPAERDLLALRVDQELSWEEISAVLSAGGEEVAPAALRKRFERLKERLARLARARGALVE